MMMAEPKFRWILLISTCLMFLAPAAADPGDDFSNNLFSDLAPILALFGEQFAKQFLSVSLGMLDHIIFAMAPLGILTAITAAIRVSGAPWLRAVIGRARENRANVELELMSSTSHEVCELWNGEGIVRSMGTPQIQEIFYLDEYKDDAETFGLYNIQSAREQGILEEHELPDPVASLWKSKKPKTADPEKSNAPDQAESASSDMNPAPNISLNLHGGSRTGEMIFVAICGMLAQSGVLIFSALSVSRSSLVDKFPKDGEAVQRYAYPVMATGTILLAIGMFVCAVIIERSTEETVYTYVGKPVMKSNVGPSPRGISHKGIRMLWVQRTHTVSDQAFSATVIFRQNHGKDPIDRILTSHRAPSGEHPTSLVFGKIFANPTEVFTFVGVVCSLSGFILQFIGIRGLNWSTSIAQLVAIGVMTILRAWVRRHLITLPIPKQVSAEFELDWLALWIARRFADNQVTMASAGNVWPWPDNTQTLQAQDEALRPNLRHYLETELLEGKNHATGGGPGSTTPGQHVDPNSIVGRYLWRVCTQPENINAAGVLGITISGQASPTSLPVSRARMVFAIRQRLAQLTRWPGQAAEMSVSLARSISISLNTLIKPDSLATNPNGTTTTKTFSWTLPVRVGDDLEEITLIASQEPEGSWTIDATAIDAVLSLWLFHIHTMRNTSLGANASTSGPPASGFKSGRDWLQTDIESKRRVLRIIGPDTHQVRRDLQWWIGDGIQVKSNSTLDDEDIIGTKNNPRGFPGFVSPIGFHPEALVPSVLSVISSGSPSGLLALHVFTTFMWALVKDDRVQLYRGDTRITRSRGFNDSDPNCWSSLRLINAGLVEVAKEIQETGLCTAQDAYLCMIPAMSSGNLLRRQTSLMARENLDGLFPLHLAVLHGNLQFLEGLLDNGVPTNEIDADGRTALHAAVDKDSYEMAHLLLERGADVNAPTGTSLGLRVLHVAVEKGNYTMAKLLLERGAAVNTGTAGSNPQLAPLQIAVEHGDHRIAELLLHRGAEPELATGVGYKPVYLASKTGNLGLVQVLLAAGAEPNSWLPEGLELEIDAQNDDVVYVCPGALSMAASHGFTEIVQELLSAGAIDTGGPSKMVLNLSASGNARINVYTSALDAAAGGNHIETASLLVNSGANNGVSSSKAVIEVSGAVGRGKSVTTIVSENIIVDEWSVTDEAIFNVYRGPVSAGAGNHYPDMIRCLAKGGMSLNGPSSGSLRINNSAHFERDAQVNIDYYTLNAVRGLFGVGSSSGERKARVAEPAIKTVVNFYRGPLTGAIMKRSTEIVAVLLECGYEFHTVLSGSTALFDDALPDVHSFGEFNLDYGRCRFEDCIRMEGSGQFNATIGPLSTAIQKGDPTLVRLLLDASPNVLLLDAPGELGFGEGRVGLHGNCNIDSMRFHVDKEAVLSSGKGRVNIYQGPLTGAAVSGNEEILTLLLHAGVGRYPWLSQFDIEGYFQTLDRSVISKDPMHAARLNGHKHLLPILQQYGASGCQFIDSEDSDGSTIDLLDMEVDDSESE